MSRASCNPCPSATVVNHMYLSSRRRCASGIGPRSSSDSRQRLRMIALLAAVALAVVGLRYANLSLTDQSLVDIREMPDSVVSAGFSLSAEREVEIHVASSDEIRFLEENTTSVLANLRRLAVFDARTKDVVWDIRNESVGRGNDGAISYAGSITLPEGQYILTCSVGTEARRQRNSGWVSWLDADREVQFVDGDSGSNERDFLVTVTGRGKKLSASEVVAAIEAPVEPAERVERESPRSAGSNTRRGTDSDDRRAGDVLVDLTKLEDDEAKFALFSLAQRTDLRVHAVGEGTSGEMNDYGWIVNTGNGRTVWEMRYQDTEHAGGDRKNRFVDETISLRRGNYVVYFVTDDSHSYDDWNAREPSDEKAWGITITEAGGRSDRGAENDRVDDQWTVVAQLTDIRDDVLRRTHFTLDRRTPVRVYALGEGDRNQMYDYAWVEDGDSRSTIWEMTFRNSEHAGGASKNRLVDTTGWLPAGEYILRYASDDSHSPDSWNDDPPHDQRNYGVTVFVER